MSTLELVYEVMQMREALRELEYPTGDRYPKTDYATGWDEAIGEALLQIEYLLHPYGQLLAQGFAQPEPAPALAPAPARQAETSTLVTKAPSHLAHLAEGHLGSTPATLRIGKGSAKVQVEIGTQALFFNAEAARCLGRHLLIAAGVMDNMGGVE